MSGIYFNILLSEKCLTRVKNEMYVYVPAAPIVDDPNASVQYEGVEDSAMRDFIASTF